MKWNLLCFNCKMYKVIYSLICMMILLNTYARPLTRDWFETLCVDGSSSNALQ